MRTTYIVCYDICDDNRLRKVFKTCKDYGVHLQYSVFECALSRREKTEMAALLEEIIDSGEDQVLFIELGPAESRGERQITALGVKYTTFDSPCFVA